jgi:hypothetical protein
MNSSDGTQKHSTGKNSENGTTPSDFDHEALEYAELIADKVSGKVIKALADPLKANEKLTKYFDIGLVDYKYLSAPFPVRDGFWNGLQFEIKTTTQDYIELKIITSDGNKIQTFRIHR